MKNLVNLLIGLSGVLTIVVVVSKVTTKAMILGVPARGMLGLAGILLLFAIALSVKK